MNVIEIKFSTDGRLPKDEQAIAAIFFGADATPEEVADVRARVAQAFPSHTVRTYVAQPAWRAV